MKRTVFYLILTIVYCLPIHSQDLPGPSSNLQTLPSGSYVIAMDNTNQLNAGGYFNMKSYGCVIHLLNQFVKVKRVILAGKAKDATDFSVDATQVKPTLGTSGVKNFKAGPFVIFLADTAGVANLVQGFNNTQTSANFVRLYRTNADVTVDVRHNLTGFVPKAAILNDGGNQAIHVAYMTWAGITTLNYAVHAGANLVSLCFTFASEPHNGNSGPVVDTTIVRIKSFVQSGGNFLAQCEAIANYENNSLGRFQTTNGIAVVNKALETTDGFPNPDLAYNQFEGAFVALQGGSVRTWKLATGSTRINNTYHTCQGTTKTDTVGTTVSKLIAGTGGLVFYLGNHNYTSATIYNEINGVRMYMNAFLTLVSINNGCSINQPLYVQLNTFDAYRVGSQVKLTWETATEINIRGFQIERKIGDSEFQPVSFVASQAQNGNSTGLLHYEFTDFNSIPGISQYRIRQIDFNGIIKFSQVKTVAGTESKGKTIIYPNPSFNGKINVVFDKMNAAVNISLFDFSGKIIRQWSGYSGNNLVIENLTTGYYTFSTLNTRTGERNIKRFLVAGH